MKIAVALVFGLALTTADGVRIRERASGDASWPQWGGPSRNFVVDAPALATTWPAGGPRRLWQRPLGDGFSTIVTDGATLYTLYHQGPDDVAVALDAASGSTKWETRYAAPFRELCSQQLGPAPRSAPLITGDRLVTISAAGLVNGFDRSTGRVLWTHDLFAADRDALRACGYSSSPLAYKNLIITTAGGKSAGVIALETLRVHFGNAVRFGTRIYASNGDFG